MPYTDPEKRRKYHKAYHRKWYEKNREKRIKQIHKRRDEIVAWFHQYKETLYCKNCNEDTSVCLDFHHRNSADKDIEISTMIRRGWSKTRILKEIEKCDVLCANCHRKVHAKILKMPH